MCSTKRVKKFRERNPWYRPLEFAKRRCIDPKHKDFKYYGGRGIKCLLTIGEAQHLFERDGGRQMKKPTLDRIDGDGHYEVSNCQFMELTDNIAKGVEDRRARAEAKGVEDRRARAEAKDWSE
jgi:hypothetical protein